jgi:hypothetical protein
MPRIMITAPTATVLPLRPSFEPKSPLKMAGNVAEQSGAPMVAHPRAIPFFFGNQLLMRVAVAIRPKALTVKLTTERARRNVSGVLHEPKMAKTTPVMISAAAESFFAPVFMQSRPQMIPPMTPTIPAGVAKLSSRLRSIP